MHALSGQASRAYFYKLMTTRQEKETLRLAARKARLAASLKENLKRRRVLPKKSDDLSLPVLNPATESSGAFSHSNKN